MKFQSLLYRKKLKKNQRQYTVSKKECYAAVLAVKKFRVYVEGQRFTIIIDCAFLKWLMTLTDLRLTRWSLHLQGFQFNIQHRKGTENIVPDAL